MEYQSLDHILFLDIETVPEVYRFEDLPGRLKELYANKIRFQLKEDQTVEDLYEKAGIFAEFGKIICISVGFLNLREGGKRQLRIKSFAGDDERKILEEFNWLLNRSFNQSFHRLCAHNGKEFDFPYICRRTLINGMKLPALLQIQSKKPWEIPHLDTLEMWKFGDYKNFTSLDLLTAIFNIPTPKDDISGADVKRVYWEEGDLDRIVEYCQKDVVALVQVFLKLKGEPLILDDDIIIA